MDIALPKRHRSNQWEFQDPKMEVRKRTIFQAIFCEYISPEI
jgi:hypothetical protein